MIALGYVLETVPFFGPRTMYDKTQCTIKSYGNAVSYKWPTDLFQTNFKHS